MRRFGHEQLSTYGIGKELSQKQWLHLARQLVQMGYLKQDEEHRTLSLTETAREALKSRAKFFGQLQEAEPLVRSGSGKKQDIEYDQALFALLRTKRKELADADGVPPYVIFSDRTLVEMAAYYPQSRASLLGISGIGQVKLEKFGDIFLSVIKPYCQQHNLLETARAAAPAKAARKVESGLGARTTLIGEAYNDGTSIESLMEQHQVKAATILNHLTKYALAGNQLRNVDGLQAFISASPEDRQAALAAFEELGAEYLKPVFEKLDGRVSYDDLKVLRLMQLAR